MNVPLTATVTGIGLTIGISLIVGTVAVEQKESLITTTDTAALNAADASVGYIKDPDTHPCLTAAEILETVSARLEMCELDESTGDVRITASKLTVVGRLYARSHAGQHELFDN